MKTGLPKLMRALFLGAALQSLAPAASAALTASINGFVGASYSYIPNGAPVQSGGDTVFFNEALPNNVTSSFAYATPFGDAADVVARVGDGWMRVGSVASSARNAVPALDSAGGNARFEVRAEVLDTIVINNPALTGTIGRADLGFLVEGVVSAGRDAALPSDFRSGGRARGSADISVSLFAINTVTQNLQISADNQGLPQDNPAAGLDNELMGGELAFIFGTPFDYLVVLETFGSASTSSSGGRNQPGLAAVTTFVSDFGNTITWAGVSNVRDDAGNPITDFTAFSGSGADFRNKIVPTAPVPLPGGLLLLASALMGMCASRFKARSV